MNSTRALPERRDDVGTLLNGLLFATREIGSAGGRVRHSIVDVADALEDAWQVTRRHGGDAVGAVTRVIDRRPYVAIGLAVALGLIAGLALRQALDGRGEPHDHADGWDHFV